MYAEMCGECMQVYDNTGLKNVKNVKRFPKMYDTSKGCILEALIVPGSKFDFQYYAHMRMTEYWIKSGITKYPINSCFRRFNIRDKRILTQKL